MAYEMQYNGVRFRGIHTVQFDQEAVRDDSDTDVWYDKFTYGCSCVINTAILVAANPFLGVTGSRVDAESASAICRNLHARFEDRKTFTLIQDNTITLFQAADAQHGDSNNGPKVRRASFKPMGPRSIKIDIVIEVCQVSCTESQSPVVGNRWQVVDEIDEQWRTTRTWRGKLRVRNAVFDPQSFRHLVVPQLSDGFQRVRMHFTGEVNALELGYEVVDRQLLGDAPPAPGLEMIGTHTETLDKNGASSIGEVYVRMNGPPGTDHQILIEQCMRIISSKVQADKFREKTNWRFLELIITDNFGPNICAVEARARVMRAVDDEERAAMKLGNMVLATLGRPLAIGGNYVNYRMFPPELYPCTTVGLLAAHLQSPCLSDHQIPQASNRVDAKKEKPGIAPYEPTYTTYDPSGTPTEIDSPGYSSEQTEAMYTHCNVEWIPYIDEGYVQLPYGDSVPKSDDTVATIRLNQPTAKVTVKMAAERIGDWPKVPERKKFTDPKGIKYVPLQFVPNFRPPEYQGDGRKLYVIDLVAVFSMSRAPGSNEFVVPSLPWDDLDAGSVPSNAFGPPIA